MFEAHVKPAIGGVRRTELRRADIVEMLDDLENQKGLRAQVNRVRSQVVAAFNRATVTRRWPASARMYHSTGGGAGSTGGGAGSARHPLS
jgi:hypothetical protein